MDCKPLGRAERVEGWACGCRCSSTVDGGCSLHAGHQMRPPPRGLSQHLWIFVQNTFNIVVVVAVAIVVVFAVVVIDVEKHVACSCQHGHSHWCLRVLQRCAVRLRLIGTLTRSPAATNGASQRPRQILQSQSRANSTSAFGTLLQTWCGTTAGRNNEYH